MRNNETIIQVLVWLQIHYKTSVCERKWTCSLLSCARLFANPWIVANQTPRSMEFSRQKYWNGLPFPSPGDLPNPGIKPKSPALRADSLAAELSGKPLKIKTTVKISQFSNTFKVMHTPKFQGWKITCSSRKVVMRSEDPLETLPLRLGIQTQ